MRNTVITQRYRFVCHGIFGICLMLCFSLACAANQLSIQFTQAEFAFSDSITPPNKSLAWQTVHFPDIWKHTHPNEYGTAWYRMQFDAQGLDFNQVQAVYLQRLALNGEVYLNAVKIGTGGQFTEPVSRNWNRPLLFIIPPLLLKSTNNELMIRLIAPQKSQGMLYSPEIGDLQNLQTRYQSEEFVRVTLNQTAALLIAGIGLLMLSLWWRRKKNTAYGLFGLAALIWALQSLNFYIVNPPVPTSIWEVFTNASFEVIAALWLISLLRFVGIERKYFNRFLWALLVLSPLTLSITPASHFMAMTDFWHFLTISAVVIGLLHLAKAGFLQKNKDANLILATLSVILLLAIHDWMLYTHMHWLNKLLWGSEQYLMQFSAPALFMIVGFMMTARYVKVLNNFELLNQELEERVVAKHQELDQNFQKIQSMLKEQAALEERERIYQDLHDDVGAKLLTLVYRAQDSNNAELARSALQDLRDVVSYTGTASTLLSHALADYRIECEQRLRDVNIKLHWVNQLTDETLALTQPQALNLSRIMREAMSNIIRHAKATQVLVTLQPSPQYLSLSICDDGIGLNQQTSTISGRGLANIKKRASLLGGELSLQVSQLGGLSIEIKIPISTFSA